MAPTHAAPGRPGRLQSLPATWLRKLGVSGEGAIDTDDVHSSSLIWCPKSSLARSQRRLGSAVPGSSGPATGFGPAALKPRPSDSYRGRLAYLRDEGLPDGCQLNRASEQDFRCFVDDQAKLRRGDLVLADNGNLRAVWTDDTGSHCGLQFLGDAMVQYVIFKRRPGPVALGGGKRVSRVAGRDTIDGVLRQIDAFDLTSLLYE